MKAVLPPSAFRVAERCSRLQPSAIREILKTTASPEVISFAGGLPAPELFPVADLAEAAREALAEDGAGALQYGLTEGFTPLRQWVCSHLRETARLSVSPEQVMIINGSQQGLDLAAKVLLDPGDTVLVENPAYLGALQAFASYEAKVVGVPGDAEGIQPEALRRVLETTWPRPKLLYLIPQFQNPTGTSLAAARRAAVVALAAEFGVPLLEDDPYGRLRYDGDARPALVAEPGTGDWLYLGTASKMLAPGLRVAWIVASRRAMLDRLVSAKQAADLHTSTFTQRIVWHYVRQPGRLEAHVERLRGVYRQRREAMLASLRRHLPAEARWTEPAGGLFLWVELPGAIDTARLFPAALREAVAFVPGEPFWVDGDRRDTLRLNFSNASEERIEEGVRRLGGVVRSALALRGPRLSAFAAP